ncbi:hypothetical protein CROQUDRAFT_283937 [Cronartium quercuum f. sp. fusiforme G11]|uniref:Uncharacterized protein n=1 Tax=Cronartium quercuum f. sp. fusiforme G11 TaxID=708437 RepID=A0A9P6NC83_9BASI|nr:hypothetical protein CROQUDRAFT_283937 [Cronartium quercuum f. sp. fusiforme G11]
MPSMLLTAAAVISSAILAIHPVAGHCKLVRAAVKLPADGVFDQPISFGFGVALDNSFPWFMWQGRDAGADAPVFWPKIEYVENPPHACGETEQWGPLNIPAWLGQSEASGVATVGIDGKFETQIFQVNRDGAGECTCEVNTDATATSWNKCTTLVNPPGIKGMLPVDRVNHTAVFQLPPNTVCKGGYFGDKCIVRIRCGWKLRFGGCLAIRTAQSPSPKVLSVGSCANSSAELSSSGVDLTESDITALAMQVLEALKAKGKVTTSCNSNELGGTSSASTTNTHMKRAQEELPLSETKLKHIAQKVVELLKQEHLVVLP